MVGRHTRVGVCSSNSHSLPKEDCSIFPSVNISIHYDDEYTFVFHTFLDT